MKTDAEELRLDGREMFIYFPRGLGPNEVARGATREDSRIDRHGAKLEHRPEVARHRRTNG